MKKMTTVIFDEEGEHTVPVDQEQWMCKSCSTTNQITDKNCRNCSEKVEVVG